METVIDSRKRTFKLIGIWWKILLGYIILMAILRSFFMIGVGYETDSKGYMGPAILWIIVFMFIFAVRAFKNAQIIYKESNMKTLYSIGWTLITFITFYLGFIPLLIQTRILKKRDV